MSFRYALIFLKEILQILMHEFLNFLSIFFYTKHFLASVLTWKPNFANPKSPFIVKSLPQRDLVNRNVLQPWCLEVYEL